MMELTNFVTLEKIYTVSLKIQLNKRFEIYGNEKDIFICPYIWNAFQKLVKNQKV